MNSYDFGLLWLHSLIRNAVCLYQLQIFALSTDELQLQRLRSFIAYIVEHAMRIHQGKILRMTLPESRNGAAKQS